MKMIRLRIDGKLVVAPEGTTILNAALKAGIYIPHLCYMEMKEVGYKNDCASCRICVVQVKGMSRLVPSCTTPIKEKMEVITNSPEVMHKRRVVLELMLSDHPKDCLICGKNGECELQKLAISFGIREMRFEGKEGRYDKQYSIAITRDTTKCIMCRRCETMCENIQGCGILTGVDRGFNVIVNTAFNRNLLETDCTFCGQCVAVCPVGALYETDNTFRLVEDLMNPNKKVIVQVAPAVRVAIGELFGVEPGIDMTPKLVTALRKLGFDAVFDTNFAADVTIIEEATELKERVLSKLKGEKGVKLPLFTSCCPAWIRFVELNYPELRDNLSSTKSPQQIFGAISKEFWTREKEIERKDLICVSIMPCTAKKYEASREELATDGIPDVDYSITTRELGRLFKQYNIDLLEMQDEEFDSPLGESTGAADIFGRTGGVLEAAIRTLYEWLSDGKLEDLDFVNLRGFQEVRVAEIEVTGIKLRVAVVHGLGAARKLIEDIKSGKEYFDAIEVMACKGGCVGGSGQPYHHGNFEIVKKRAEGLQDIDYRKELRESNENESVMKLYDRYIGEANNEVAHRLLHTYYFDRKNHK
ncbi:NADH-dependent [FeFe] hydrogenase, group A6 [Fusobacterium sp.]|uniref:NADH-dependent [FeFe] hydrogenase, group A6 n=1 Tax=Fusobacterium sp. TaxID=68766 RepID=UPI0026299022|nr:NADH-dependent [FeFe] hydrogenase, group A6 [Fusobacterium sp.]